LATSKASVSEAQAAESFAEKRLKRFEELARTLSVEERLVDEQRTQWEAAKGRRLTIQSKTAVEERQVALETAQIELAQAEIQEAELRLGQLQTQLRSER
jgi:multidrug resistance efflux pump